MLTEVRWQKEQQLMQSVFPQFKPFTRGAGFGFGFEGYLKGPRSGRYRVLLEADEVTYPQCPPNVRMDPQVGEHWIEHGGQRVLCATRNWQPARSTFANTLLAVVKYLDEHDGVSSSAPRYPGGSQTHLLPDHE
jgi:hypothetical protein